MIAQADSFIWLRHCQNDADGDADAEASNV